MKPIRWVGSSKKDLLSMPEEVRAEFGHALYLAQEGDKPDNAKPLKGYRGAGVLEIIESHDGNAYRAVYTVRFEEAVYVLHCFQKKSRDGISTPQQEMDLIDSRLKVAEQEHEKWKATKH
jgi:phage-related protein